ncbi:MAG: hypothetical protein EP349_07325 [Alphaproteobacteria bacterium]|nr:MAG: hypothetical protein EP349_07325 [Alphaproteobacteria bacterium]
MSSDNTRINPKHYIGRTFTRNDAVATISALIVMLGGAAGTGIGIHSALDKTPDTAGTALQETAYQEGLSSINALDLQQTQLEIAQKQHDLDVLNGTLTGDDIAADKRNLRKMNEDFAFESHRTLVGLFNAGVPGQEADISEQQFLELAKVFEEKIGTTEGFGLEINAESAAYLDEARADMADDDEITGNPVIDAQTLSDKMAGMNENPTGFGVLGAFGALLVIGLMLIPIGGKLEDWAWEDKRVERRRPKKTKGINH